MCVSFFLFEQKTAYELRISDWSSDVCSSDLRRPGSSSRGGGVDGVPEFAHDLLDVAVLDCVGRRQNHMVAAAAVDRPAHRIGHPIGSASGRERVCQYV